MTFKEKQKQAKDLYGGADVKEREHWFVYEVGDIYCDEEEGFYEFGKLVSHADVMQHQLVQDRFVLGWLLADLIKNPEEWAWFVSGLPMGVGKQDFLYVVSADLRQMYVASPVELPWLKGHEVGDE